MAAARVSAHKIAELEDRIGHRFANHARLIRALTHASATQSSGDVSHYERLEFLGDRVLGLCVADLLFDRYPDATEGELSVRLNALVSGKTCADIADEIGLHHFIQAGTDSIQLQSKRMRSVRADVTESLIAAIYLDGGLPPAKRFVSRYWSKRLDNEAGAIRDSKTALQEWAHATHAATPTYRIVKRSGPDHDPTFIVEVLVKGSEGATGRGRSKRAAEQAAAQAVLLREVVWVKTADGTVMENTK